MHMLYHFHPETGEHTAESEARLDPIDGEPMVPANATLDGPPDVDDDQAAVWDGAAWAARPDHRGAEYWLADGTHHDITDLGDVPPEDSLSEAPPPTVPEQRAVARLKVLDFISEFVAQFTAGVSATELASWPVKAAAARSHTQATPQPIIVAEAAVTGETPAELAQTIRTKADLYEQIIARVTGLRRHVEGRIEAAASAAAVDTAVADALQSATEMADDLGVSIPSTALKGGPNA